MASSKSLQYFLDNNFTEQDLVESFEEELKTLNVVDKEILNNLKVLFNASLHCKKGGKLLFPNITLSKDELDDPKFYIAKWIERYIKAYQNKPSTKKAQPKKSVNDSALMVIIKENKGYTDEEVKRVLKDHNLYMSAENAQGNLLEEYINSHAKKDGWVWAEGETIRACDFVKIDRSNYFLLQIKNKFNSENSSSSNIRKNTKIEKWFRLGQKSHKGKEEPVYMWEKLNKIMGLSPDNSMSEENYRIFLTEVGKKNKDLL